MLAAAAPAAAAYFTLSLQHGGLTRTALVHAPPGVTAPRPVVLNLHGGGGDAASHRAWTRMDAAAERHGFVAVYPNGTGPRRFFERFTTRERGRRRAPPRRPARRARPAS